jgi:predicted dehydrogenase
VEKPPCLTEEELSEICAARLEYARVHGAALGVMVGFNRRFAPLAVQLRAKLAARTFPAFASYSVNAGALPAEHWSQDPRIGGGRIIGESCHFLDFLRFLIGSPIVTVQAMKQRPVGRDLEDNATISLGFKDGSLGNVNYFSSGNKAFPKERCEVSFDGKTVVLNNFLSLTAYGLAGTRRAIRQDKGHDAEFATFVRFVNGSIPSLPVEFDVIENVMRATFAAVRSMRTNTSVDL